MVIQALGGVDLVLPALVVYGRCSLKKGHIAREIVAGHVAVACPGRIHGIAIPHLGLALRGRQRDTPGCRDIRSQL